MMLLSHMHNVCIQLQHPQSIVLPIIDGGCSLQMHDKLLARRLLDIAASEGDAPTWINVDWEGQSAHVSAGMPVFWQGCIPDR